MSVLLEKQGCNIVVFSYRSVCITFLSLPDGGICMPDDSPAMNAIEDMARCLDTEYSFLKANRMRMEVELQKFDAQLSTEGAKNLQGNIDKLSAEEAKNREVRKELLGLGKRAVLHAAPKITSSAFGKGPVHLSSAIQQLLEQVMDEDIDEGCGVCPGCLAEAEATALEAEEDFLGSVSPLITPEMRTQAQEVLNAHFGTEVKILEASELPDFLKEITGNVSKKRTLH